MVLFCLVPYPVDVELRPNICRVQTVIECKTETTKQVFLKLSTFNS